MNEAETLSEFFQYLDSLTKSEFDSDSLTGHGRNFIKSEFDSDSLTGHGRNFTKSEFDSDSLTGHGRDFLETIKN